MRSPEFERMTGGGFAGLHGRSYWMAYLGDKVLPSVRARTRNPDDHEAHAAGRRCRRCGRLITGNEPVRRRAGNGWIHQRCA